MSGLLRRAIDLRKELISDAEFDEIPQEEREKILDEIDKAVNSKKNQLHNDIYIFQAEDSDVKFPLLINLASLILITVLSLLFYFIFASEEDLLTSDDFDGSSVENEIIRALKEDSDRKLSEKENEILQVQNQLDQFRNEQKSIELKMQESLARSERELRERLLKDLEEERAKLTDTGLSDQSIENRIEEMEKERELELARQLDRLREELDEERLSGQKELEGQIDEYEKILASALSEKQQIEREYQEELNVRENQLEGERTQAITTFQELEEQKNEEIFLLNQLFTKYDDVRKMMEISNEAGALEELSKLEEIVLAKETDGQASLQYRKDLDFFLIGSLKKLITAEPVIQVIPEESDKQENDDTTLQISRAIESGNSLFLQGEYQLSKESYLEAIALMPLMEKSYLRLININEIENQQIKDRYRAEMEKGDRQFLAGEYGNAISQYEKAIDILEDNDYSALRLVSRYSQAQNELNVQDRGQIITEAELDIIRDAALREEKRKKLIEDFGTLEAMISGQTNRDNQNGNSEVLSNVGIKVQIDKLLTSDIVREQYPTLYEDFNRYLQVYEDEKISVGKMNSLKSISDLIESLSGGELVAPADPDSDEREMFLQIIGNLKEMITSL